MHDRIATYRPLARFAPEAVLPGLARSLDTLGNPLGDLGRREEALAATQEAVAARRRMVEALAVYMEGV
ncbi:MAG: hypothetical protein KC620_13755 [Myxococcales bacterium]|nr:hypothetical protein [Myxococcales bacterium]